MLELRERAMVHPGGREGDAGLREEDAEGRAEVPEVVGHRRNKTGSITSFVETYNSLSDMEGSWQIEKHQKKHSK